MPEIYRIILFYVIAVLCFAVPAVIIIYIYIKLFNFACKWLDGVRVMEMVRGWLNRNVYKGRYKRIIKVPYKLVPGLLDIKDWDNVTSNGDNGYLICAKYYRGKVMYIFYDGADTFVRLYAPFFTDEFEKYYYWLGNLVSHCISFRIDHYEPGNIIKIRRNDYLDYHYNYDPLYLHHAYFNEIIPHPKEEDFIPKFIARSRKRDA